MTTQPTLTTENLAQLGVDIGANGFGPNEARVSEIVDAARSIRADLTVLDVLADRSAADVVRARSLSHLTREWASIEAELVARQKRFDQALDELLTAWVEHQDLKASPPEFGALIESRQRLDSARVCSDRKRQALKVALV